MTVLMVVGILPTDFALTRADAATAFVGGTPVSGGNWDGWTWMVFGEGAGGSAAGGKNTIKDKGSSITLSSGNKGGKIAGGKEGINYFYCKLNKASDFIFSVDATLDTWASANQQAWGIEARAAVGTHDDKTNPTENSVVSVGGVQFSVNKVDTQFPGHKNGAKLEGINPSVALNSGIQGETYRLTMQKSGDTITLSRDNKVIGTVSASSIFTGDGAYVGVYTSRAATVTYSNFHLDVIDGGASSVSVDSASVVNPTKTLYIKGNTVRDIDLEGFSANVTVNGSQKTITGADCVVKSADFSSTGDKNIVLDYFGQEISIPVTVKDEAVESFTMEYSPVKTDYYIGESLDFNGLNATINYNSGITYTLKDSVETRLNGVVSPKGTTEVRVVDRATGLRDDSLDTAGAKTVYIDHYLLGSNDDKKTISYDINVSGATVSGITLSGPNQTTFYKEVPVKENAYKEGLLVTATFSDGSTKVMSDGFTVEAVGSQLDVNNVGEYTYKVTYGGKEATYTLKVVNKTVKELVVDTLPNKTNYVKGEDFSSEGLVVNAVYDSGEPERVVSPTIDSSAFKKDVVGEYTINVSATVAGTPLSTSFVVAVREKTAFTYNDLTWKSIIFGQSVSKEKMTISSSDGKVIIEAKEGAGKCTDDGQDGIAYYYTELDGTKDNFEITAKVTVDYFITKSSPDNQEGFGIMVRDAIGTDGDSSIFYSNAMSVGGYYGGFNVFGREGVNSQDDTLGKKNHTLFGKGAKDKVSTPTEYTLTLKKDNSGIYATMKDSNGDVVKEIENRFFYLSSDAFAKQQDTMYVGFMAARGAKIEVDTSSIKMNVTSQNADAPQKFAPETPIKPAVSMGSLAVTADADYTFIANVNTKGLLTVKQNGKTIASQKSVEAGSYEFPVTLLEGENKFQLYLEPDATQNITSAVPVIFNTTVERKLYGTTKDAIYVSPNGSAKATGSKEDPLDVQTALNYCQIGQAVYALPGTYNLTKSTGVWKYNNGSGETGRKYFMKDPASSGDVIMDFGGSYASSKFVSNTFDFSGDYWTVDGIKFANGGGVRVGGNHNILKNCEFYGHSNSGLSISRTDSATDKADWPSYNQIISCNAYENRDKSDNNADGFAAKLTCGDGNVFRYCIAAYNADDGWDLFSKGGTGAIGEVEIYDSVCFANGYTNNGGELKATRGDGNGFKMGGSGIAVNHKIFSSYSFGNRANGFTNNSDPMGTYSNCTGYNNGGSNLELHVYTGVTPQFKVTGFKSFADDTGSSIPDLEYSDKESQDAVISLYVSKTNFFRDKSGADGKSVNSEGTVLAASEFESLSQFVTIMTEGIPAISRNENGSINLGSFLKVVTKTPDNGGGSSGDTGNTGNTGGDIDSDDDYDYDDDDTTVTSGSVSVGTSVGSGNVSSATVDESLKDVVGFTPSEIAQINNGASASVTLEVKDISASVPAADKQTVTETASGLNGDFKVGIYLDLSVIKTIGGNSKTVANLTAPVKVSVALPDSLINTNRALYRQYKVIRIHGDQVDVLDAEFDAATKKLSFYSDKFSTYAVVYSDSAVTAPMTGDSSNASMYVMILMIAALMLGYEGFMFRASKKRR